MSKIHAVIFDKSHWTKALAHHWLVKNNLKPIAPVRETLHFYRYRIRDPKQFKHFITRNLHGHIELIIGFK